MHIAKKYFIYVFDTPSKFHEHTVFNLLSYAHKCMYFVGVEYHMWTLTLNGTVPLCCYIVLHLYQFCSYYALWVFVGSDNINTTQKKHFPFLKLSKSLLTLFPVGPLKSIRKGYFYKHYLMILITLCERFWKVKQLSEQTYHSPIFLPFKSFQRVLKGVVVQ